MDRLIEVYSASRTYVYTGFTIDVAVNVSVLIFIVKGSLPRNEIGAHQWHYVFGPCHRRCSRCRTGDCILWNVFCESDLEYRKHFDDSQQ